jgi:hypothetical protein
VAVSAGRFARALGRGRLRDLLHLDDSTRRLALSLAVGVFISFTPLYGLQTLLAIGVAVVTRLNRAATVAGAWLNLPWFAPLVYAGALHFGTLLVPDPSGTRGAWLTQMLTRPESIGWRDVPVLLDHVSLPLLVGTSVLGVAAGVVTYVIAFVLIARHRRSPGGSPPAAAHPGYHDAQGAPLAGRAVSSKEPGA